MGNPTVPVQIWVDKDSYQVSTNRHRITVRKSGHADRQARWRLVGKFKNQYRFYFEMKEGSTWPFEEPHPTADNPSDDFSSGDATGKGGEYSFTIHAVPAPGQNPPATTPLDPDIVIDDRGGLLLPIDDDFWRDLADRVQGLDALAALRLQEDEDDRG